MKPFWKPIVVRAILRNKKQSKKTGYTSFEIAKGFVELKGIVVRLFKDILLMTIGIFSAAFGLKSFLLPANFIDGGVTGISLLAAELTSVPLPILLVVINLPFVFL